MTKEQVIGKIKNIISKDERFKDVMIQVSFESKVKKTSSNSK